MKKENLKLKGIYKITKAKIETPAQWALHDKIQDFMKSGKEYISLVRKLNKMCKTEIFVCENIIPTVGRGLLANNLTSSSPDNDPRINYTALGTSATAVANSDIKLVTEFYRKGTASATNADNIAYVTCFYTAAETSGTFKESGLFCNGTGAADSGVLFSRVLLNSGTGIVKSVTESLTIDYVITIS